MASSLLLQLEKLRFYLFGSGKSILTRTQVQLTALLSCHLDSYYLAQVQDLGASVSYDARGVYSLAGTGTGAGAGAAAGAEMILPTNARAQEVARQHIFQI